MTGLMVFVQQSQTIVLGGQLTVIIPVLPTNEQSVQITADCVLYRESIYEYMGCSMSILQHLMLICIFIRVVAYGMSMLHGSQSYRIRII